MNATIDQPFLRTLAPLLGVVERHLLAWLDGPRLYPVSIVQRAEMEGILGDVRRKAEAISADKPTLTVMCMGGTGVGKSTLLNALAGSTIAEASYTRPTTRDPVVYYHHSIVPERLDPALRVCRLVSHERDTLSQVILVDTPDVDSNDLANRDKLQSLLHVADIVLFVGSQEKYHDRLVWDLFKLQRQRRAFAFVLNKWDRCMQISASGLRPDDDLLRDLKAEGFDSPRLFRTTAQAWVDATNGQPANLPEGDQFRELKDWLERGLTRREIEAVKARGVLQLLTQARDVVAGVRPPELANASERVVKAWPTILADEAEVAAEVLAGSLDPASTEIEQHFSTRGEQRLRGLMAVWLKLTSIRWGVKNLLRTPLPSIPRVGDGDGLDFHAIAADRSLPAYERILKQRSQAMTSRLLVEADQNGFPIALLSERLAAVHGDHWAERFANAVAEAMLEVERDCINPTGVRSLLRRGMTFLANYLPEVVLLGSLVLVIWLFVVDLQVPSLAMMLMPVYVTVGTLILLQLLMAVLFPIRWRGLRDDFRKRLEKRLTAELENVYLPLPGALAGRVKQERLAVEGLATEIEQVIDWLQARESAANIDELYGS